MKLKWPKLKIEDKMKTTHNADEKMDKVQGQMNEEGPLQNCKLRKLHTRPPSEIENEITTFEARGRAKCENAVKKKQEN